MLENDLTEEQMLLIAKELGLSETAFIRRDGITGKYAIRYFSPKMEIPLCGHATLASSKVLFSLDSEMHNITFRNIQNTDLPIRRNGEFIEMRFPAYRTKPANAPDALLRALGIQAIINCEYNEETKILLLEIGGSSTLRELRPNFQALHSSHNSINGVLVTAPSDEAGYDFESRYFWPWSGTNEDPVTGGTHTFLANYWNKRLHKTTMQSFQCSERTGFMEVKLVSADEIIIKGLACIVLVGKLQI